MSEHPRSGHPKEVFRNMDPSPVKYVLLIFIAFCLYFLGHWLVYLEGANGEAIVSWIITGVAPILVVPQLLVFGDAEYQRS